MKKLVLFSLAVLIVCPTNGYSKGCTPQACGGRGDDCIDAYSFVVDPPTEDEQENYICEKGFCDPGTVLFNADFSKVFICTASSFLGSWNNTWIDYKNKVQWCSDEQIRILQDKDIQGNYVFHTSSTPAHSKKAVVNTTDVKSYTKADTGKAIVLSSKNVCYAWVCEYGYTLSSDKKSCIDKNGTEVSPSTGGGDCKSNERKAKQDITVTAICSGDKCVAIKKDQCYDKDYLDCMEASALYKDPANWNGTSCNCGDKQVWNKEKARCEGKKTSPTKSCKESRSTAEGKACCDLPSSVAKWTGGHCVCQAADTEFKIENGVGVCAPKGGCGIYKDNPEAFACCEAKYTWVNGKCECPEGKKWDYKNGVGECVDNTTALTDCIYKFNGRVKCANGNSMEIKKQKQLTKAELGGLTCDQFNSMYQADVNKLNQFFTNQCADVAFVTIVTGPSAAEIESAKSVLSAFFSAAQSNASVWKDSEGKFNTARLASDLTAGVVLGSVGGVVSGVVIKKKQVQKGFEALHCAVGGQTIADWGDEFNVGLRR